RYLELPTPEPKRDIAVVDKEVGSHQLRQLGRIQMVADIGKSDGCGNAGRAQGGSQQNRLRHAIVGSFSGDLAGAVILRGGADVERIVPDPVAHGVEQADRLAGLGQVAGAIETARSEFANLR